MTDFDLRHTLRDILDETDLATPDEVTDKLVGYIPQAAIRSVLSMVLRDWVRSEMSRYRMKAPISPAAEAEASEGAARSIRSAKVEAIRAAAPGWLRDRVCIGNGAWALVGDCTYDNLQFLQADREQSAARHAASAESFKRLGALVKKHRVARVGDLPARVLEGFEWRAAP